MIVILAIASVILVAACCSPLCSSARRTWRERRDIRAEAVRGIAGLESMLAEHARQPGTPPRSREGDTGKGENAPNPRA
jgi:hypothetical protein